MPQPSKRRLLGQKLNKSNEARRNAEDQPDEDDASLKDENASPTPQAPSKRSTARTRTSAASQIAAKDAQIASLTATILTLQEQLSQHRADLYTADTEIKALRDGTLESFSNKTRARRNNVAGFIEKRCSPAVRQFVRAEVRRGSKTKRKLEFHAAWSRFQREKAVQGVERRKKSEERRRVADAKLAAIVLELDLDAIESMNTEKLREQLMYHREILRDEILLAKLWKDDDMRLVLGRRKLVKEARLRELQRRASKRPIPRSEAQEGGNRLELDEDDEMRDDAADWEDIDT
uniref:Pinin/SDK/MemA protein domain-containing protein n=1 Tax=Mycena chlorophos TaxID=658473 RepID=A0ABQ0LAH5_MYCCL|nr:predicted protein [Mycena chlorophos]